MQRTVILTVRVDYTTDARNDQHAQTAARMAIKDNFPTVEDGVTINRVEVYGDGQEWFVIDEPRQANRTEPISDNIA